MASKKHPEQDFIDRGYIVFLLWHCEAFFVSLHRAYGESDEARRTADVAGYSSFGMTQRAFTDFESALAFATNITKMLWPRAFRHGEKARGLARGRRLRKLLGIRKREIALERATKVRNAFEHLDTRLDDWAAQTTGNWMLMHALSRDLDYIDKADRFNRFNPHTEQLLMFKYKISLRKLSASVWKIWYASIAAKRDIETRLGPRRSRL